MEDRVFIPIFFFTDLPQNVGRQDFYSYLFLLIYPKMLEEKVFIPIFFYLFTPKCCILLFHIYQDTEYWEILDN